MNVLVLAGGSHQAPLTANEYPVWLTDVDGTLLLERQVGLLQALSPTKFTFIFRSEDSENYFLENIIEQFAPRSTIIGIRGETAGAACSALLAIEHIDMDAELIVASATDQIDVDLTAVISRFREINADAGALTFPSLHPRYSYVRIDKNGWVVESAEKRPISRLASTGFYWFAKASDFFDAIKEMIIKDAHVHGKFYVCPALNELILKHKKIAVHQLAADQYHPLKTEKQLSSMEQALTEGTHP
ncbi:glycosyltransferase family 2 protein [Methylobacterium sp. C33D]